MKTINDAKGFEKSMRQGGGAKAGWGDDPPWNKIPTPNESIKK